MTETKVDYFIKKFEAIPDNKWCAGVFTYDDQCCALGHCGVRNGVTTPTVTNESIALANVFSKLQSWTTIAHVNDGRDPDFPQNTPKARILAALQKIKNN